MAEKETSNTPGLDAFLDDLVRKYNLKDRAGLGNVVSQAAMIVKISPPSGRRPSVSSLQKALGVANEEFDLGVATAIFDRLGWEVAGREAAFMREVYVKCLAAKKANAEVLELFQRFEYVAQPRRGRPHTVAKWLNIVVENLVLYWMVDSGEEFKYDDHKGELITESLGPHFCKEVIGYLDPDIPKSSINQALKAVRTKLRIRSR